MIDVDDGMGYWDATDRYLRQNGGQAPTCPSCGSRMFAVDDHGRFDCFCAGSRAMDNYIHKLRTGQVDKPEDKSKEGD